MQKIIPDSSVLIPDNAKAVFHGQIFDTYQWLQPLFDGTSHTFEMLKRPDTVVAICIVDDQILVVDDEQPHFGSRKSFPGGRVDNSDESVEAAARREVAEETGYTFKQWRLIQVHQPHNKIEWFVYLFIAWEVESQDKPHLDPGEKITTQGYDFSELKTMALNKTGYIGDVKDLFKELTTTQQLLAVPAFQGQSVDR